jgi:hypothetical protein
MAGGIVGWLNRVPPDEAINFVAVRHVALTRTEDRLSLTYVCESHDYFTYYISDGALVPDKNLLDHPIVPKPLSFEHFETVVAAATGWELKDVVVTAIGPSVGAKEKLAMLLGSVSGFYAGRWVFSTRLPGCASEEVLTQLQHVEYWDKLKRAKCKQICLRYRLWFSSWKREPLVSYLGVVIREAARNEPEEEQYPSPFSIPRRLRSLQTTFLAASSNDGTITEREFRFAAGGMSNVMLDLYDHPEILKGAFPSGAPFLAILVDEDPEVVKREISEELITLNFATSDDYDMLRGSLWSIETIVVACLIIGFLVAAISGTIFLVQKRFIKTKQTPPRVIVPD